MGKMKISFGGYSEAFYCWGSSSATCGWIFTFSWAFDKALF